MDDYLIEYEDYKNLPVKNLLDAISLSRGQLLQDLKVRDLTYHNSLAIFPGQGVYIFRENKDAVYVGKVSSMSFTERIAKHFDFRNFAWMNGLIKAICSKKMALDINDDNLKLSSEYAFDNLNLVLINFTERSKINRTERLLRSCMSPLNKFKYLKENDLEKILFEY